MDSNKDAYGHIVWNAFKGLPYFMVLERDDGYLNVSTSINTYFDAYEKWGKHEQRAINYAKGKCLDLGCSAGRVLIYLQKKKIPAIGIDTSPLSVKVCKAKGCKNARVMDIKDIEKFPPRSFDSIIMFGHNFGLLQNRKEAKRLLASMYKITSKIGTIIAETRDPYLTDNPTHFKYIRDNKKRGKLPGQQRIRIRFMQYATDWHDYLYVSKKEMKNLLAGTGWKIERFIDSENHKQDGRYFAIIRKA